MKKEGQISSKPVVAVALVTAVCLLGDSMLYIALPIYYKEAGLQSLWEAGLILSLNRLVRIPVNPAVGWFYRHFSLRAGIVTAVILAVITTIGYGAAYGLAAWIVLRLLWGIAWSFFRLGGYFTVMECSTDTNRGTLMGKFNGLYRLGSLGGMLGGGVLVSLFGISAVSVSFGLLMIIGIPLTLKMIPAGKSEKETNERQGSLGRLSKRVLKAIVTGMLLAFLIQGMFVATLSIVISENYGETIPLFGMLLGVTALTGILQGIRWMWEPFLAVYIGRLSDRSGSRIPLFIIFLVTGSVFLSLLPVPMPLLLWISTALGFMAVCTALTTLVDAVTSDIAAVSDKNKVMTYYAVFLDIGAALGPLVSFALLNTGAGIEIIYSLSGAVLLLLAIGWSREKHRDGKHGDGSRASLSN